MAYEIALVPDVTLDAGADLSADQFKFVKMSGDNTVILCAAATDLPIGVLQNDPLLGQSAQVRLMGVTKLEGDAALVAGNQIGTSADGQADVKIPGTDITEFICGQVLDGVGAAGELATVAINCINAARAA